VTLARRLDALESSLTPTQLVLRWLDEAHAHGSLEVALAAVIDVPPEDLPLNRLWREAAASARAAARSRGPDAMQRAVRKSVSETVFRFFVVLRANVTAQEAFEKEALVQAATSFVVAMLVTPERPPKNYETMLRQACAIRLARVAELEAMAAARARAAERYLDGRELLFPGLAVACEEQLRESREHAALTLRLAELDGIAPDRPEDDEDQRLDAAFADLVEHSKATTLEKLGDGASALRVARAWLRPKLTALGDDQAVDALAP
jgi:hypothetical protein